MVNRNRISHPPLFSIESAVNKPRLDFCKNHNHFLIRTQEIFIRKKNKFSCSLSRQVNSHHSSTIRPFLPSTTPIPSTTTRPFIVFTLYILYHHYALLSITLSTSRPFPISYLSIFYQN